MATVRRLLSTPLPLFGVTALFVAMTVGSVAGVRLTNQPSFCGTCHEMRPYASAWQEGPHSKVSCIACHVEPGAIEQFKHKAVALKEVYDHFATSPKFPRGNAEVPDSRCLACHRDMPARVGTFDHALHTKEGSCVSCHRDTGHKVSPEALKAEGVYAGTKTTPVRPISAATSGSAEATSVLHAPIDCSRCHDLNKVACSVCHKPRHADRGTCQTCHRPGAGWVFAHPTSQACATCHKPPAMHFPGTCTSCHTPGVAFKATRYRHTSTSCQDCHARPASHRGGSCAACHPKGGSWSFSHPSSTYCSRCHSAPANHFGGSCASCHSPRVAFKATTYKHTSTDCASCHRPPKGHYSGACATCHKAGVAFRSAKFTHPSSTSCASCHSRPSGHRGGTCFTCHRRPGVNWSFSHPPSSSCASCHGAPGGHYGTTCASCHAPSRAWSSATFSHPALRNHSYRSFACVNCHPGGYGSATCAKCHGSAGGPTGD